MQWKGQGLKPKNEAASAMGKANPSKNTKPEVQLRSELHRLGFRFRKHYRVVDGLPRPPEVDVAFTRLKLAVQIHGIFWHGRKKEYKPKHNSEYWQKKFADNRARDRRVARRLKAAGWTLCTVWDDMSLRRQINAVRRFHEKAREQEGNGQVASKVLENGRAGRGLVEAPGFPSRGSRSGGLRADTVDGLQWMAARGR